MRSVLSVIMNGGSRAQRDEEYDSICPICRTQQYGKTLAFYSGKCEECYNSHCRECGTMLRSREGFPKDYSYCAECGAEYLMINGESKHIGFTMYPVNELPPIDLGIVNCRKCDGWYVPAMKEVDIDFVCGMCVLKSLGADEGGKANEIKTPIHYSMETLFATQHERETDTILNGNGLMPPLRKEMSL